MQLLRASEYRRLPWKNGGGETREILISPPGATLDEFDWRVSLATIERDGPFSHFNAIDRTLCVIRGQGIHLAVDHAPAVSLLCTSEPYSFAGESAARAELIDGPIVDLNVMSRRGSVRHTLRRATLTEQLRVEASSGALIVFCQRGSLICTADGRSAQLESEDCVVLGARTEHADLRATETADIILIELSIESSRTMTSASS